MSRSATHGELHPAEERPRIGHRCASSNHNSNAVDRRRRDALHDNNEYAGLFTLLGPDDKVNLANVKHAAAFIDQTAVTQLIGGLRLSVVIRGLLERRR